MSAPPANDQTVVTGVDITDTTCARESTGLINLNAVQLQLAPFRARRIIVRTEATSVLFHSSNHRVRTRTSICEGQIAYVVFGPRAQGTVNGIPVHPDLMLAVAAGIEVNFVVNADWENATFLLPPDFIHAHFIARQRGNEFCLPQESEILEVRTGSARELFSWAKQLAESAAEHASTFNENKDGLLAIQCDLVENLLKTLGAAKGYKTSSRDRTKQRQSLIVKIAEDYALSQKGTSLYVTDLCRVTGVSERTLQYAFKEVMGLTPMAFLTKLRLHRVRHELIHALPGSTTVANTALRWGFWHFGELSQNYKNCFGELPSDTLLRARDLAT